MNTKTFITYCKSLSINCNSIYGIHSSFYSITVSGFIFSLLIIIWIFVLKSFLFHLIINNFFIIKLIGWIGVINILIGIITLLLWIKDYSIENLFGFTLTEQMSLIYGIKLLILSEFMLFFMCFWVMMDFRLVSNSFSLFYFYPLISSYTFAIPYSNVMVLLYSSLPCQSLIVFVKLGFLSNSIDSIAQTISAGMVFMCLQFKEFLYSWISLSDCMIGSIFYFTTGLHGFHVFVGLIMFYFIFISMIFF